MNIPYGKQEITQEDIDAVLAALKHPFLTQGPKVKEFEEKFATYIGSKYAVAVSNGTAALHLSAIALGIKPGSRAITTPITFSASANCVQYCGGDVEFADIDPTNILLDIDKVRQKLESFPKGTYQGIIPVDFAGYPVHMESFRELANEHKLWLLEDACHAPGGWFTDPLGRKKYCGNGEYADLAIFSFHPVKHIACGEGGMVTTNNPDLYEKLLSLRTHGIERNQDNLITGREGWVYDIKNLGYNYRIPDILCALGISQLTKAADRLAKRREIAKKYDLAFHGSKVEIISPVNSVGHAYHLYIILVSNRKELYNALKAQHIYSQVHYIPVHTLTYYKNKGHRQGDYPNAELYYSKCLSLPMYPSLKESEQDFVIQKVLEFAK